LVLIYLQIDSPIPPSDEIGVASVQGEVGEIIAMKTMKMAWVPYIPLEQRYIDIPELYTYFRERVLSNETDSIFVYYSSYF